jgi:hypothetical protein
MDVLGAVASGVQLATLCYQIAAHLHSLPEDRQAIASLHEQILELKDEVNDQLPHLSSASRIAAQDLAAKLDSVITDIAKFRQKKRFAWLKTPANRYYQAFMSALQQYQTRAVAIANEGIGEVYERVGPEGLSKEVKDALDPIGKQLADLNSMSGQVAATHKRVVEANVKIDGTHSTHNF